MAFLRMRLPKLTSAQWLFLCGLLAVAGLVSFTIGGSIMQGAKPTLQGFAVVNFAAYLWFLLMPVEILAPYYVSQGYAPAVIFSLAVGTAIVALTIDYAMGLLVPRHWLERFVVQKHRDRYHDYLVRYGSWIILFFAATPLSSPILTLVAGIARFPFRRLLLYTLLGLSFKYAVLVLFGSVL